MTKTLLLASAIVLAIGPGANAQTTAHGTLTISGTLIGSMVQTISTQSGGATLTGSGSSTAGLALGSFSVNSPNTTVNGITKSPGTGAFTLQTTVAINIGISNQASLGYTLTCAMAQSDGNTYTFGGVSMTSTPTIIISNGTYGSPVSFPLSITIPTTGASGTISNTINFTAIAN